jgi:hypothetical protein
MGFLGYKGHGPWRPNKSKHVAHEPNLVGNVAHEANFEGKLLKEAVSDYKWKKWDNSHIAVVMVRMVWDSHTLVHVAHDISLWSNAPTYTIEPLLSWGDESLPVPSDFGFCPSHDFLLQIQLSNIISSKRNYWKPKYTLIRD